MADLKMNEFATVSSVTKVVGVDGSGNNRLISPNDLIQVGNRRSLNDSSLNSALKTGFYTATFETENKPIEDYGFVEVLSNGTYIIQKFFALNEIGVFYRKSINGGSSFNEWTRIK